MTPLFRVFLDSNILFSAAYRTPNRFERLWDLANCLMLTSEYCIGEVRRNLRSSIQGQRFDSLLLRTEVVPDPHELPDTLMLPAKDVPVVAAAIGCRADVLLTGDRNHFARFYGRYEAGVLVESPDDFWRRFPELTD